MPVVSRVNGEHPGFQAKAHKHCGTCARPWCTCHEVRSRFFADAKHGGAFFAEQLARQWCREARAATKRRQRAHAAKETAARRAGTVASA